MELIDNNFKTLDEICLESLEFVKTKIGAVVFVKDTDGDHFYLYSGDTKLNRVAIQSLNISINPVIHGNIRYKVVAKTDSLSMRKTLISRFLKEQRK